MILSKPGNNGYTRRRQAKQWVHKTKTRKTMGTQDEDKQNNGYTRRRPATKNTAQYVLDITTNKT